MTVPSEARERGVNFSYALHSLRCAGWTVAVHNDYRLAGEPKTFWLMTHPSGRYVKGEGATDMDALMECDAAVRALTAPLPCAVEKEGCLGAVQKWFDLHDAYHKASGSYNARLAFVKERREKHDDWTPKVDTEYRILNDAQRAAIAGAEALYQTLLAAAPIPVRQGVGREETIEECAKLAESVYTERSWHSFYQAAGRVIASNIRALSLHQPEGEGR